MDPVGIPLFYDGLNGRDKYLIVNENVGDCVDVRKKLMDMCEICGFL